MCEIFFLPWHRLQVEGTNGFYCLFRKTNAKWGERNCPRFVESNHRCLDHHGSSHRHGPRLNVFNFQNGTTRCNFPLNQQSNHLIVILNCPPISCDHVGGCHMTAVTRKSLKRYTPPPVCVDRWVSLPYRNGLVDFSEPEVGWQPSTRSYDAKRQYRHNIIFMHLIYQIRLCHTCYLKNHILCEPNWRCRTTSMLRRQVGTQVAHPSHPETRVTCPLNMFTQ